MDTEKKYGFYSLKAAEQGGTVIYRHTNGKLVHVTGIDSDPTAPSYGWTDMILLGEVKEYVSQGHSSAVIRLTTQEAYSVNQPYRDKAYEDFRANHGYGWHSTGHHYRD